MRSNWIPLIVLLMLALVGCAPSQADRQGDEPVPPMEPTVPPSQETPTSTNSQDLIKKAREDLAQRLSISISQINPVEVTEVVWQDSSLGCPQPGIMYIQVLADGFLIQLKANHQIYEYHTDDGKQIVLCKKSELPVIPVTPGDIRDGQPWMPVEPIEPGTGALTQ